MPADLKKKIVKIFHKCVDNQFLPVETPWSTAGERPSTRIELKSAFFYQPNRKKVSLLPRLRGCLENFRIKKGQSGKIYINFLTNIVIKEKPSEWWQREGYLWRWVRKVHSFCQLFTQKKMNKRGKMFIKFLTENPHF